MKIDFTISRNLYDYKPILEGLVEDFGCDYYHAILAWCKIIDEDKDDASNFWKVWLIKNESSVIGICGLYSQYPGNNSELWLAWFGVLPSHRMIGVGRQALDFMQAEAKSMGCNTLMSYVDKKGTPLPFYYNYGFSLKCDVKTYLSEHPELNESSFGELDDYVIEMKITKEDIFET